MRILITILLLVIYCNVNAQWWDSDYTKRVKITADADSSVTDTEFLYTFPLSEMPADFWSSTQTDGDDIRVINNAGNQVPFYVEQFDDTNEKGTLYFKAGASSTVDSVFYVYYGNALAAGLAVGSTYGQYNVFTNYNWYYPMAGAEDGAGEVVKNKVENDSHLDPQGTKTGDAVTGKLDHDAFDVDGKAYWTDPTGAGADDPARGVNDAAHFGRGFVFPVTISAWIYLDEFHDLLYNHASWTYGTGSVIAGQYYSTTGNRAWIFDLLGNNDGDMAATPVKIRFVKWNSSNVAHQININPPDDTLKMNTWINIAVSISADGTDADIFLDGVNIGGGSLTSSSIRASTSSTNYPFIGAYARSSKNPDGVMWGAFQDVSFSDEKLTDAYVAATFKNQNTPTTFWDIGAAESNTARRRVHLIGFNYEDNKHNNTLHFSW